MALRPLIILKFSSSDHHHRRLHFFYCFSRSLDWKDFISYLTPIQTYDSGFAQVHIYQFAASLSKKLITESSLAYLHTSIHKIPAIPPI